MRIGTGNVDGSLTINITSTADIMCTTFNVAGTLTVNNGGLLTVDTFSAASGTVKMWTAGRRC